MWLPESHLGTSASFVSKPLSHPPNRRTNVYPKRNPFTARYLSPRPPELCQTSHLHRDGAIWIVPKITQTGRALNPTRSAASCARELRAAGIVRRERSGVRTTRRRKLSASLVGVGVRRASVKKSLKRNFKPRLKVIEIRFSTGFKEWNHCSNSCLRSGMQSRGTSNQASLDLPSTISLGTLLLRVSTRHQHHAGNRQCHAPHQAVLLSP